MYIYIPWQRVLHVARREGGVEEGGVIIGTIQCL
mgnify:CR=1 FL=1